MNEAGMYPNAPKTGFLTRLNDYWTCTSIGSNICRHSANMCRFRVALALGMVRAAVTGIDNERNTGDEPCSVQALHEFRPYHLSAAMFARELVGFEIVEGEAVQHAPPFISQPKR